MKNLLLIFFVFAMGSPAISAVRCGEAALGHDVQDISNGPSFFQRLSLERTSDRFQRVILSGMLNRYWNDSNVMLLARDIQRVSNRHGSQAAVGFSWENIVGQVERTSTRHVIAYTIPTVNKLELAYGARPRGLDMDFVKVLTGIMRSAESDLKRNPDLRGFEIRGAKVVNSGLIQLLQNLGFEMIPGPLAFPGMAPEYAQNWRLYLPLQRP